LENFYII